MPERTLLEAIREGMRGLLATDPDVLLIGEDIGVYGGAFKVTEGLQAEFGSDRVIDTPLAEAAVIGAACGAAMMGQKPVAELQFIDFISCAGFDQLVTVAAKSRYRTGVGCGIVVRGPAGGGGRGGPYHSACPEMWAVTTPGIKVVFPSTPYDAKGLFVSSVRDPDPVLFLEHKFLYRRVKGEVPDELYEIPLGKGIERRPGKDATIITYGATTLTALAAAEELAKAGHDVRVIDLRTLVPLDTDIIVKAAKDTSRIVIVHEHPTTGGIAGEIAARINELAFDYLDAPIRRVAPPDTPVPYAPPLEDAYLPQAADIVRVVREVVTY